MISSTLLSVIIPVYNADKYLNRCVQSIVNQNYKNLEIILINDGSTDKSGEICDEFLDLDKRIKVIHQNNQGAGGARNKGLSVCKGDFISFVDSDDWIDPEMYSEMLAFALENKLSLVECEIRKTSEPKENSNSLAIKTIESRPETLERILRTSRFSVCSRLFNSKVIKGKKFRTEIMAEDVYFTAEVFKEIEKTGFIRKSYYNYYVDNKTSVTRGNYSIKKLNETVDAILSFQKFILSYNNPKLNFLMNRLVSKIAFYNFKLLFYNDYLDPDKRHRRELKNILLKNFQVRNFDHRAALACIIPIDLFRKVIQLNAGLKR